MECSLINVSFTPKIAIIATGDELVGAEAQIKPWQIRRSNTTAITSALLSQGYDASEYHLKDDLEVLREKLKQLLHECDMLILTGGVSMGKFDFVPQVFKELGVEEVFHKVTQRPGKPLWFGKKGNKTIFGLPGNPVSAVINFHRYIIPQLAISLGQDISKPVYASLNDDFVFRKNMTRFLPVVVTSSNDGKLLAKHQSTNGSGDFGALSGSDGFLELDAEISEFKQGYTAPFYPW